MFFFYTVTVIPLFKTVNFLAKINNINLKVSESYHATTKRKLRMLSRYLCLEATQHV